MRRCPRAGPTSTPNPTPNPAPAAPAPADAKADPQVDAKKKNPSREVKYEEIPKDITDVYQKNPGRFREWMPVCSSRPS